MIVFEQTVPVWLPAVAVLLAAGIGGVSAWLYLSRSAGTLALSALYAAMLALLFWCLLLPGCRDTRTQLIKPRFLVALDTSGSMLVRPDDAAETRWDRALRALDRPWVEAVTAEAELEILPFDSAPGARVARGAVTALTPDGAATRLRDSLRELAGRYTGLNVAGLLLLSDGHDTREAADDWASDPLPFPVYTVRLEDDVPWALEPDVRIDAVVTPRRVVSGRGSEMRVVVSGQGTQGDPVAVQLFSGERRLDEQVTRIPDTGGRREVVFALQHPEVGVFPYRVHVPPLPGERQLADNTYELEIAVQDPRNRLLYVEGMPRFEYRFLRRVLLADEQVSPVIFFSMADGTPQAGSPTDGLTADMGEQELLQFKIVILGNLGADELGERRAASLVRFVDSGGSLVLLGGTRAWGTEGFHRTALRQLLPVSAYSPRPLETDVPFETALTPLARAHPAFSGDDDFWSVLPPVLSVFPDAEPRPGAEVLATAETPRGPQPILVTQRYGQGRVAAVFTDSLWRWQLAPETDQQPYARFWTQLISWMLPDPETADRKAIDLFADQDTIHIGETIELSARLTDPDAAPGSPPEVLITGPDERVVPYAMTDGLVVTPAGRSFPGFTLTFTPDRPGPYTARAVLGVGPDAPDSERVRFQVRAYSPETAPRPIREDILRRLAEAGGGRYFNDLDSLDRALSVLRFSVIEEQRSDYRSLWQRWPILVLLMGLAAAMWVLRKRLNLP